MRLWDVEAGRLLDTCVVSEPEPEPEPELEPEADAEAEAGEAGLQQGGAGVAGEGAEEEEEEDREEEAGVGGDEEEEEEAGGGGEEEGEEGMGDDRMAMGPKCAPVTCVTSSEDG